MIFLVLLIPISALACILYDTYNPSLSFKRIRVSWLDRERTLANVTVSHLLSPGKQATAMVRKAGQDSMSWTYATPSGHATTHLVDTSLRIKLKKERELADYIEREQRDAEEERRNKAIAKQFWVTDQPKQLPEAKVVKK